MSKITAAHLHSAVFCAGVNLSDKLSSQPGAKQCQMSLEGNFLKVTVTNKSILIPFTNVRQIEMQEEDTKTVITAKTK